MDGLPGKTFSFGRFKFDSGRLVLFYDDEIVKDVEKRALQVLAVLLTRPGEPVSHEEIIKFVWSDNPHGATSTRVNQYVSRLRKALASLDADNSYIETLQGRGYRFTGEAAVLSEERPAAQHPDTENGPMPERRNSNSWVFFAIAAILLLAITAGYWKYGITDDVEEVKRVVKESQMFESLVMYRDPADFTEEMLDRYWLSERDGQANFDRSRIRQAVKKMLAEGRYYGEQSECTVFEFEKVEINRNRDIATVRTFEKWSLEEIKDEGKTSRKKTVGPYFVDYIVRKVNGRWLIERSTTARTVRPVPQLASIEITQDKDGKFLASVVGSDIEPLTIWFDILGPDCTITRPCRVENVTLREKASITSDAVWNIPIDLGPGEYQIVGKNGDSSPSASLTFVIP
jgi:DNA-binding winged helix-turn-helix (wHTH) protein